MHFWNNLEEKVNISSFSRKFSHELLAFSYTVFSQESFYVKMRNKTVLDEKKQGEGGASQKELFI